MRPKYFAATLAIASLSGVVTPRSYSAQSAVQKINIEAKRFQFTPAEIELKKDVPVVFLITSKDIDHGLKLGEMELDVKISKGKTVEVPITPTQAGTFVGQCSSFCGAGHGEMKLTFHVTE